MYLTYNISSSLGYLNSVSDVFNVNNKIVEFRTIGLSSKFISVFSAEIVNEIDSFTLSKLEIIFIYMKKKKQKKVDVQ